MPRAPKPPATLTRAMIRKIDGCRRKIAAERDKLDDLLSELEGIRDDADEAVTSLEHARDYLSRLL